MERMVQLVLRRLGVHADMTVAVALEDGALAAALRAALEAQGARVAGEGEPASGAIVGVGAGDDRPAAGAVRQALDAAGPGDRAVAIFGPGATQQSPEATAVRWLPLLGLERARGEAVGDAGGVLVSGPRRAKLPTATRKRLRGLGHAIEPTILIGKAGLAPEVCAAARAALERHGIVKAKLTPGCELDKKEVAEELRWATGAILVQRVGKTALLHRPDVPLEPPVKRSGRR